MRVVAADIFCARTSQQCSVGFLGYSETVNTVGVCLLMLVECPVGVLVDVGNTVAVLVDVG